MAAGSNPGAFNKLKKSIYENYEQVMSYCIHESED